MSLPQRTQRCGPVAGAPRHARPLSMTSLDVADRHRRTAHVAARGDSDVPPLKGVSTAVMPLGRVAARGRQGQARDPVR